MPNLNFNDPLIFWGFMALVVWDGIWKAIGLWKASQNHQKGWFVVIFLINSVGILPIVYLKFFQQKKAE